MAKSPLIVYFSNVSNYTHRFVERLNPDFQTLRIPVRRTDGELHLESDEPYALIVPTYGSGNPKHSIPKQVVRFLNDPDNRKKMVGVIGSGNKNFGGDFCLAGRTLSKMCKVPLLYRFELAGTMDDVEKVNQGLEEFWQTQL